MIPENEVKALYHEEKRQYFPYRPPAKPNKVRVHALPPGRVLLRNTNCLTCPEVDNCIKLQPCR